MEACHRLGAAKTPVADAPQVVEIKPDWPKGYSRLGGALAGLRQWDEAKTAYEKGALQCIA